MIFFLLEKAENHNVVEHYIKRHRVKRLPCKKRSVFKVPTFSSFSCSNFYTKVNINPCSSPEINVGCLFEQGCVCQVVRDGIE